MTAASENYIRYIEMYSDDDLDESISRNVRSMMASDDPDAEKRFEAGMKERARRHERRERKEAWG